MSEENHISPLLMIFYIWNVHILFHLWPAFRILLTHEKMFCYERYEFGFKDRRQALY